MNPLETLIKKSNSGLLGIPWFHVRVRTVDLVPKERACCGIWALAWFLPCSFDTAYRIAERAGRLRRCGFNLVYFMRVLGTEWSEEIPLPKDKGSQITLREFCRTHPDGRFIVCIRHHALCVIDGVVMEGKKPRFRATVKAAWRRLPGVPPRLYLPGGLEWGSEPIDRQMHARHQLLLLLSGRPGVDASADSTNRHPGGLRP